MTATIFSIGTATPAYSKDQLEISKHLSKVLMLEDEEAWLLERIYRNSHIEKRYSVLPHILLPEKGKPTIGMSARNALYKQEAPLLAERAAKNVIENWGRDIKEITHVISVSCTGAITPGLEFKISQSLGLDPYVSRLGINFMGCFGAFKGLSVAQKIACESPNNRVLIVCTELCTLHFRPMDTLESIVIHSLFADGSSGAIIGMEPREGETPHFEMIREKSYAIPDSQQEMTWDASDFGFDMTLSAKVPGLIEKNLAEYIKVLIGEERVASELDWAVHPGGKAILESVEKSLKLDRSHTVSSWNVLSTYGNLSSATFLYVLSDLLERGVRSPWSVGIGFGPGLSIEGVLLRNCLYPNATDVVTNSLNLDL